MTATAINRVGQDLICGSLANGGHIELHDAGIEALSSPITALPYLDDFESRVDITHHKANASDTVGATQPQLNHCHLARPILRHSTTSVNPTASRTLAYVEEQRKMVLVDKAPSLDKVGSNHDITHEPHSCKEVHFVPSNTQQSSSQSTLIQTLNELHDQKDSQHGPHRHQHRHHHHKCRHYRHHQKRGHRCHRHRERDDNVLGEDVIAPLRHDLHRRDKRFSTMVEECIGHDKSHKYPVLQSTVRAGPGFQQSIHREQMPKMKRTSMMESIMGFEHMRPQDLVYSEGAKVDGGFGFTLPSQCREGTVLLDSGAIGGNPDFSSEDFDPSSEYLGDSCFSDISSHKVVTQSDKTISSFFSRMKQPGSLTSRLSSAVSRPSPLNIQKSKISHPMPHSDVRGSICIESDADEKGWDDIKLDTGDAHNRDKSGSLADTMGLGKPARPSRRGVSNSTLTGSQDSFDRSTFVEKDKKMSKRSYYQKEKDEAYYSSDHAPPGLSQADVVAICLIQGMVPPGLPPDPTLVTWSTPLSPTNPRNWSPFHKWYTCILVSIATFLANAGTNMLAPALGLISHTYHEVYTPYIRGLIIGCYVLAFAFAPLIFGPMSEVIGRKPVLLIGCFFFFVFTLASGFVTASYQMMIFRFITALGASAPMSIGGAIITDIFPPEKRGLAMTVFALAPQLGPVVGPLAGGMLAQEAQDWRLIFYVKAIAIFVCCAPMVFIRESYTPRILAKRADQLRKESGNSNLTTIFERRKETITQVFLRGSIRPLVLFASEPIIQMICAYVSVIYGVIHLLVATFPAVMGTVYAEYPGWASMHFIGVGVGTICGGIVGGYLMTLHSKRKTERNGHISRPEFKLFSLLYITWLAPIGLSGYFFITYFGIHWIFADLFIVIFCFGISAAVVSLQSYIVDSYSLLAGSALTSTIVVRSVFGFGATVIAEGLLLHAGLFWSGVVLTSLCVSTCVPIVFIVYFYGAKLRARSKYATHKR